MRLERADPSLDKGWDVGPWNSSLQVAVGYANRGINEPHVHALITEIYLVARGTARIRVERQTVALASGDVLTVEAGEAHTFLGSSPDYFHFVVHTPGLSAEMAKADKSAVPKARLGL
jgi:quercetin dioxygenase-like cupin family protein